MNLGSNSNKENYTVLKCKTNMIPILMHQMRILTNQVSSVVLRPKVGNPKNCNKCEGAEKTIYCVMKLSQIRQRIELCMREIILRFEMNL